MTKLLLQSISTGIISIIIALLINFINPQGIPLIGDYSKEAKLRKLETKKQGYLVETKKDDAGQSSGEQEFDLKSDISLYEAYDHFKKGSAIFLDSREESEFNEGHIMGAINIPAEKIEEYKYVLQEIPPKMKLITYCEGTDCDLSIELADYLLDNGFFNVEIFFGGWLDWQKAGYPSERTVEN